MIYKPSFIVEFKTCLGRAFKNSYRNDYIFKGKILQNVIEGIMFMLIFHDLSTDITGVQNRNGLLFFILIPQLFETNQDTLMTSKLYTVPMERDLYYKEKSSKMYGLYSYLLPKIITELPLMIILTILFSTALYWVIGLHSPFENFVVFSN